MIQTTVGASAPFACQAASDNHSGARGSNSVTLMVEVDFKLLMP